MSPSPPPLAKQNTENCADGNYAIGFRDGAIVRQPQERVQLEIVDIKPHRVSDGTKITVTVRLQNVSDQPILVPWATPPVEPENDPKTGTKSWENVSIRLTFGTHEDRSNTYLKGEADLAATPSNRAQHTELLSGQSAEVKFSAIIECYSSQSWECQKLPTTGHAQMTAHWWESLTTREEEGCSIWKGNYQSRMATSAPFPITYIKTSASDDQKTNQSK
ncbi:MAG: hypothetical protein DMG80_21095 [Acidobacteria bacterium]|nr:MAG: hypothetical protein DMG80_21095 [Acidobacteriota bacterium]